jgi:hypothetical protein
MLDDTLMQRVAHLTSFPTRRQLNTMRESHGSLPKDYFERVDTHLRQAMSEVALTHKSSLLCFAGGDAGVLSSDGYDEACREYAKKGLFDTAVGDIWLLVLAHLFDVIVEIYHLSDAGVQTLTMDPFTAGLSTGRSCWPPATLVRRQNDGVYCQSAPPQDSTWHGASGRTTSTRCVST